MARIVAEAGASFDHLALSGDNVFLSHPATSGIVLSCAPYRPLSLSVSWHDAFPPAAYYTLLAKAGAIITHEDAEKLNEAARLCQVDALKNKDENATRDLPAAALDCTAFKRDDGGTLIDVRPNEPPSAE